MNKILVLDNYDSFTYNLVQAFCMLGETPVVVYNDDPRLLELATDPEVEKVCISPGPSHPINSGYCLEFLKRLDPSVPVLGICLGHQILGLFAGEEVVRERREEDPEDDRPRLAEAGREHEREQLGLVGDLGERDDADGNEECRHAGLSTWAWDRL